LSFKKYSNTDNTVVFLKSIAYRAYTRYAIKVYKSTVLSVLLYEGMNYNKWHLRLVPTASTSVKCRRNEWENHICHNCRRSS